MLPAMQQAYNAWAVISGSFVSFQDTIELLDQPMPQDALEPAPEPLAFESEIRLDNVRFRYAEESEWVLDGVNLTIPKGARVGFVGSTGSGKSTLMDLLMGLLEPTEGQILVDGEPITGRRTRAWQRTIAHVPQAIYLSDATLAENIAFGLRHKEIDLERVRRAANQAQIAQYIESDPQGYDAVVGERGVRLSGGQRQRIGIARALYRRADVLVLDEATSALDNETEQSVMEAIENLDRSLTVLLIAHRLTTVRNCDVIVEVKNGRVNSQLTYNELVESDVGLTPGQLARTKV